MSRPDAAGAVRLVAEFTALAGRENEVERLIVALADDVRREPGCLDFTPHRVAAAPRDLAAAAPAPVAARFVVTETYRDADAFAAHIAAPYGAVFNAALGPLIEEDGSVLTFLRPLA